MIPTYTARHIGKDTLVFRGICIHIDRTFSARAWCTGKGMAITARATADGETFDVFTGTVKTVLGSIQDLSCAVPV